MADIPTGMTIRALLDRYRPPIGMLVAATADGIAGYMLPFGWNLRGPAGTVPAQGDLVVALGPVAALGDMAA